MKSIIFLAFLFVITATSLYLYQVDLDSLTSPSDWGALGDFFGGVLNPIFAFFSLLLLFLTLKQNQKALLQNKDALKLNSEELSLTRKELKKSKKALKSQAKTQQGRSFEDSFFNLLGIHQDLLNSIDLYNKKNKGTTTGRDCFKSFYCRLSSIAHQKTSKESQFKSQEKLLLMMCEDEK